MKRFAFIAVAAALVASAHASFTALAFNNATIQPTGPRQGANGLKFWNIEGSNNGSFASWVVADFNAADFQVPFTVSKVAGFKVLLTESDAAFTSPGMLDFWLSTDTSTSIAQDTSSLIWQTGVIPEGAGSQLPLIYLGSGSFNTTGNTATGQLDTFSFNLSSLSQALVVKALNTNGVIRLVVTGNERLGPNTIAATFAGYTNTFEMGPQLSFSALPKPVKGGFTKK